MLVPLLLALAVAHAAVNDRSFVIDYDNNQFLRDGKPFRYISAGIHYFRVPHEYWEDRLTRIRSSGANALEFYIPWNWHEPYPGKYLWSGDHDLEGFIKLAQKMGFVVILRGGPYVCGEWENGGLPWWLLRLPNITLRDYNPVALQQYDKWYSILLPKLRPLLYKNGGPVIMLQVENEYGSYAACDMKYRIWLRDTFNKYLHNETILFTTDGPQERMLKCGHIPGTYATVDFGPGSNAAIDGYFHEMRKYTPKGPLVNSEFYPGWLDLWASNWSFRPTQPIINSMNYLYSLNASFNFYMFHGGTNFGFWNGAEAGPPYQPCVTSYDYDAPLSEAGDTTPKFLAIKQAIQNLTGKVSPIPTPSDNPKAAYGIVNVQSLGPVTAMLNILSPSAIRKTSHDPLSFENVTVGYGFMLYETIVNRMAKTLSISGIHDRGYVIQDNVLVGILQRDRTTKISLRKKYIQKLQILVENMGRINYRIAIDPKGIIGSVLLDGTAQQNWTMYPIQIENVFSKIKSTELESKHSWLSRFDGAPVYRSRGRFSDTVYQPSIFYGTFPAPVISDTFLQPTGWGKGQLYINGYNLGRYWPTMGPQVTLYVPKRVLKSVNTVVLMELEKPGLCSTNSTYAITFIDYPILNKTTTDERATNQLYLSYRRPFA